MADHAIVQTTAVGRTQVDPGGAARPIDLPRRMTAAASGDVAVEVTVSVVIPARNEAASIPHVLRALPSDVFEVIVVDGASTDGTVDVVHEVLPRAIVVQQEGRGKGDALRCGFAAATGDIVVMLDADGSMDPAEIPTYVAALLDGADLVKGSRFLPGAGSCDLSLVRGVGNLGLLGLSNLLTGNEFTDLCYGYLALWRRALERIEPRSDGFEVETELVVRSALAGLRIVEVPTYEQLRRAGVSNLRPVHDGVRIVGLLGALTMERHRSRRGKRRRRSSETWTRRPDLQPVGIAEVELTAVPDRVDLGTGPDGVPYRTARVLLRRDGAPVAITEVATPDGVLHARQLDQVAEVAEVVEVDVTDLTDVTDPTEPVATAAGEATWLP